jgi:AraC-like DNA-binding protein
MLARMDYREFQPPERLRALIKVGWTLSMTGDPAQCVRHVATPDGCMEIIRRTRGSSSWGAPQPGAFVAGLITRPTGLDFGGNAAFVGLRVWPWAWNAIGRLPCPSLLDRWTDLADAAPGFDMPAAVDGATDLFQHVTLEPEAAGLAPLIPAARSVDELAAASGRSHRSLQRWFKREIGIPPRHYLRLLRFQEAFVGVQAGASTLADHAAAHGYADQAHMAREFRAHSGQPARTARRRATGPFL